MTPARTVPASASGARWLAALVLVVAGAIAYHHTFAVPFIFDDEPSLLANPTLQNFWRAWWPPTDGGITVSGRPLLNVSFALNHALSGTQVWSYHLLNLLIHLGAGGVLFDLVHLTLRRRGFAGGNSRTQFGVALFSALLWLLHPLQVESVTYIVQRAESLMGLFYLLTFWCFARSLDAPHSSRWRFAAIVCCALGMATKEVMVTAPLLLALYDRTFVAGSGREVGTRRRFYFALASTWLILAALVCTTSGRGGTAGFATAVSPFAYFKTQLGAIPHYFRLALWPHPLVLDYGHPLIDRWSEIAVPALLLAATTFVVVRAAWRSRAVGFAGVFFLGVLAPTSSVVPIATQTIAEHRVYLPLAALAVLGAAAAYRAFGKYAPAVLALLCAALATATIARNADYATAISIYRDTVMKRPDNARAAAKLGEYYRRAGRLAEARGQLERSLALEPGVAEVLNNLGNVTGELGESAKAVALFRAALARAPHDAEIATNLGNALIVAGDVPEGIAQLRRARLLDAASELTWLNLANALARAGQGDEARAEFAAFLHAHPQSAEAHANYGLALRDAGRLDEALAELATAVRLAPGRGEFHNYLGVTLGRAGRLPEALAEFEAALRLNPRDETAEKNAALARRRLLGR